MGKFFGGIPPAVAPWGTWFSGRKLCRPLTLFNDKIYICTTKWSIGYAKRRNLEILSKGRSDIAVGYSKCW
jgi:hypothetical protein